MKKFDFHSRLRLVVVIGLLPLLVGIILLIGRLQPAEAAPLPAPAAQKPDNSACLACHEQPGMTWTLPSGEVLGITVDPTMYSNSVHQDFSCSTCHVNITSYPHPKNSAVTIRDFELQFKSACNNCHEQQATALVDSAHTLLANEGNPNTPICINCHNPHYQVQISLDASGKPTFQEKATIAKICATCHNGIYQQYIKSVHGAGVLAQNPDVPACDDCHGIHTISNAQSVEFRLKSPELCAKCHTDASIMDKYGISTDVLSTYVADFHGTTVTLFEKQSPDQQTNAPVCFDCHGVHDISAVNNPQTGLQIKQNLLAVCQKCHPDATTNFPTAWLSHYIPSPTHYALVYYVNLFYMIFIPSVIGIMAAIIVTDVYKRVRPRGKTKNTKPEEK